MYVHMCCQAGEFNNALVELWRMGVLLMVTSRRAVNARLQGPLKLELLGLPEQDAMQLLRSYAGGAVAVTEEQARELAAICGCNALAITIIASFLSDGVVTPEVGPCARFVNTLSLEHASIWFVAEKYPVLPHVGM
jgi:hypothetical protein